MNLRFDFILNHSKATAANVYLMVRPEPILTAWLNLNPELYRAIWKAQSSITAETLAGEGRVYGGGLHKLEPKELANVTADFMLTALPRARDKLYRQQELFTR